MNRARRVGNQDGTDYGISFRCPGCGDTHAVPTNGPNAWGYNGNLERPTLTPSILVRSGHHASAWKQGEACWCTYKGETSFKCGVCHSFVVDGRIQFLGDCTHALAGQTVDLPEVTS